MVPVSTGAEQHIPTNNHDNELCLLLFSNLKELQGLETQSD